jgi:hypothetical protein
MEKSMEKEARLKTLGIVVKKMNEEFLEMEDRIKKGENLLSCYLRSKN